MTYLEYKGSRFQVKPAKGDAWSYPCDFCDLVEDCITSTSVSFCHDYYPKRIIFEKL